MRFELFEFFETKVRLIPFHEFGAQASRPMPQL